MCKFTGAEKQTGSCNNVSLVQMLENQLSVSLIFPL